MPRSGIGLILPDGRRRKVLVNQGGVTSAGEYFYQQTGTEAPSKFDFAQTPERAGRSLMIKLLDGSKRAVSRFDPVAKEFKPTALGKKFFSKGKVEQNPARKALVTPSWTCFWMTDMRLPSRFSIHLASYRSVEMTNAR